MTIVTGDLTLPNQLTVQGWLAQFFSKSPPDYGLNTFQGQGSFEIEAPPADIFGFPEGKVTLTLSRFNEAITEVKDRKIQSITIEDGSGKSMQIQLINPTSAQTYFETLDNGSGAQAFYELLLPDPETQFFRQEGSPGNDFIEGFSSNDFLLGGGGDDTFRGGPGNDQINGGPGLDIVEYFDSPGASELALVGPGDFTFEFKSGDQTSKDQLVGTERIIIEDVQDGEILLSQVLALAELSKEVLSEFADLYIAKTGSMPTMQLYLDFAEDHMLLSQSGITDAEILSAVSGYLDSTTQPDATSTETVTDAYGTVLGRLPDDEGLIFWTGVLDSGDISAADFIGAFLAGTEAPAPDGASQAFSDQQESDQGFLTAKAEIALDFGLEKGMTNSEDAATIYALIDGTAAGFESAEAKLNELYAEAIDPNDGDFTIDIPAFKDGFEAN